MSDPKDSEIQLPWTYMNQHLPKSPKLLEVKNHQAPRWPQLQSVSWCSKWVAFHESSKGRFGCSFDGLSLEQY